MTNNYKEKREGEYPSIQDQLDMIWHSLDTYGSLGTSHTDAEGDSVMDVWYYSIKEVKDKYPAPSE